jgi:hypothetical protein
MPPRDRRFDARADYGRQSWRLRTDALSRSLGRSTSGRTALRRARRGGRLLARTRPSARWLRRSARRARRRMRTPTAASDGTRRARAGAAQRVQRRLQALVLTHGSTAGLQALTNLPLDTVRQLAHPHSSNSAIGNRSLSPPRATRTMNASRPPPLSSNYSEMRSARARVRDPRAAESHERRHSGR